MPDPMGCSEKHASNIDEAVVAEVYGGVVPRLEDRLPTTGFTEIVLVALGRGIVRIIAVNDHGGQ